MTKPILNIMDTRADKHYLYDTVSNMSNIHSIWWYNQRIRVTYVSKGWLVVWHHREHPPTRYDCKDVNHEAACHTAVTKIYALA